MPITRKNNRNWMFWLTLFVLFCTAVYALRSVLLPFVAGIVIGYLLDPFASRFERWGMNRTLATFLVLFLVAIIVLPAGAAHRRHRRTAGPFYQCRAAIHRFVPAQNRTVHQPAA